MLTQAICSMAALRRTRLFLTKVRGGSKKYIGDGEQGGLRLELAWGAVQLVRSLASLRCLARHHSGRRRTLNAIVAHRHATSTATAVAVKPTVLTRVTTTDT